MGEAGWHPLLTIVVVNYFLVPEHRKIETDFRNNENEEIRMQTDKKDFLEYNF